MRALTALWIAATALAIAQPARSETREQLTQQVRDAENGFAGTMAARDFKAFQSYIADDAVFFGGNGASRGKAAVVESWKSLYEKKQASFSWQAASVEVLESGQLAHSSGPVMDAQGKRIGTFNSIWRREADGQWHVVFDRGCDACNCAAKAQ